MVIQYTINIMDSVGNYLDDYTSGKKRGPTSQRAYLIQQICDDIFDDNQFAKLLGQTKLLTANEIRDIYDQAKAWKTNPQALFWKLLKEKNAEIKEKLKFDSEDK